MKYSLYKKIAIGIALIAIALVLWFTFVAELPWYLAIAGVFLCGQCGMWVWWYSDIKQRERAGEDLARWRYWLFNDPRPGYFFEYFREQSHRKR